MSAAGFSLKDEKEEILAEVRTEIHKLEFQADSDKRSIQELNGITESQRRKIDHTLSGDEQLRRDFFKADMMHMVFVMENDAWETQEWMKPKFASPVACLAKTSELIRSLRDEEKVKSQEPGMRKWLRVHDESGWSLITSLICRFLRTV